MQNNMKHKLTQIQSFNNIAGRNDRYTYAKAELDGAVRFMKFAPAHEKEHLQRELGWADFMKHVEQQYSNSKFRGLRDVELYDEDTLLTEWVEAPFVADMEDGNAWELNIERYVQMLVLLDKASLEYYVPEHLKTYAMRQPTEQLDWWLEAAEQTPFVVKAIDFVTEYTDKSIRTFQHGDLTPWQIFDTAEQWIVIDGERAGDDLPRFNDVAYSYGRLALRCNNPSAAERLLELFVQQRGLSGEEIQNDLRYALVFRLLGMVGDAAKDGDSDELAAAEALLLAKLG